MFKRKNRLVPGIKLNNSYLSVNSQFILKEKKNGLTVNRFGIVVSKKIDKKAVVRNRVKRFFRTVLMSLFGKMSTGHDILIIVKKGIFSKTKEENLLAVKNALGEAGIIKMSD